MFREVQPDVIVNLSYIEEISFQSLARDDSDGGYYEALVMVIQYTSGEVRSIDVPSKEKGMQLLGLGVPSTLVAASPSPLFGKTLR